MIISPPKSGKTTLLKHMASAICQNHPNTHVIMLLIDERPEEVTDFRRELVDAKVLYSSSDQDIAKHVRMARLAMLEGRALDACMMQTLGVVRQVTEHVESAAAESARELASLDPDRLAIWRSSRGPGFVDRFRATVVHKL